MEGRVKLPRKARDDAVQRLEEEQVKATKKRGASKDSDNSAPKVPKKRAKSEDRVNNNGKSVVEDKPAAATKKTAKAKPMRRSRSCEPETSVTKRKIDSKSATIEELVEPPIKKARSNKAAASKLNVSKSSDEEAQAPAASVANGKNKKAPKGQGKAAASKSKQASTEPSDAPVAPAAKTNGVSKKKLVDEQAQEPKPAPKARGKAASKKTSSEEGEPNESNETDDASDQDDVAAAPKKGRAKKPEKPKADVPTKKGAVKKAAKSKADDEENEPSDEAQPSEKQLQNDVSTDYSKINFGIKEKFNFKIATWNVAGLRALANKNSDYFIHEDADIICMNELKVGGEKEIPEVYKPKGYHAHWNVGKGFGGVGLLSKIKPIEVSYDIPDSEFEDEKRLITAEFEKFFVISVYVVNAGRGLKTLDRRLKWNEAFDNYVKQLDKKKPVIIAGDMNVSHQEIDLANPKSNKKNAGFTQEERDGFTTLLSHGFVDTYRHFHPEEIGAYTYWSYMSKSRSKNVGWRLDYFLASQRFLKHVKDNVIRSNVLGSDHCPIVLFLNL